MRHQGVVPWGIAEHAEGWSVQWANESGESGKPFDVLLRHHERQVMIEVKSTRFGPEKRTFEISLAELECAKEFPDDYLIVRIYFGAEEENQRAGGAYQGAMSVRLDLGWS